MNNKIKQKQLDWQVDSAGTSGWHAGEQPDSRAITEAASNGIDLSTQKSRKFTAEDFEKFDFILAMDSQNYNNIVALADSEDHKSKVQLILNYLYPGENRAVPDPYYDGGFDRVFELLDHAIENFISQYTR